MTSKVINIIMECPFMESSKIKSSDPDDFDIEVSYPVMYVSQLPEKILPLKFHDKQNQLILIKYPVYLKNTLYQPLHIKKLRSLDSMEKLIPFDDFKKQGNISFYKEEYEKAIEYYGRASELFEKAEDLFEYHNCCIKIAHLLSYHDQQGFSSVIIIDVYAI